MPSLMNFWRVEKYLKGSLHIKQPSDFCIILTSSLFQINSLMNII